MKNIICLAALLLSCAGNSGAVVLKTGAHIHGEFSHGNKQPLEDIVRRAREKGLDAVMFSDTAISKFEYGLRPFENVLKVSGSQKSILHTGPRRYLKAINKMREKYPDLLIVPGTEAAAFYRWEGSPFGKLVMKDWHRHMLIFGMEKPADYAGLPVMGNSRAYPWNWKHLLAALALVLVLWRIWPKLGGKGRAAAGIAGLLGFYLLYPFATPRWSIYSDKTPWEPYRALAAYGHAKGALTFWAHPEAPNWLEPQKVAGPLHVGADMYAEGLEEVSEIDGFAVFMEGYKQMLQPGGQWDAALQAYASGKRPLPAWAIAELDYVAPGYMGTDIDSAYMLVDAESRTTQALLQAIKKGHFQSVMGSDTGAMRLSQWELRGGQAAAQSGEEAVLAGPAVASIGLEKSSGTMTGAELTVVCDGSEVFRQRVEFPSRVSVNYTPRRERGYCRAYAVYINSMVASNPIFYRRSVK
ncbi:MAG: hypothetical protein GX410_07560 [Elusimicrobia bacterium]|nr:hypothetical protein [Elusimicrobiota bacterium]